MTAGRVRLSKTEDQIVWDLRAAHWRWDFIAQHLMARRARLTARMRHYAAVRARETYRREMANGA